MINMFDTTMVVNSLHESEHFGELKLDDQDIDTVRPVSAVRLRRAVDNFNSLKVSAYRQLKKLADDFKDISNLVYLNRVKPRK